MTHRMTIADLHARVQAIFLRAGMNEVQAAALARVITAGEREKVHVVPGVAQARRHARSHAAQAEKRDLRHQPACPSPWTRAR